MALLSEAARGPCQGGSSVRSREDGASKGGGNGVRRRPRRRVYEYDTLERATAGFAEENRVESSSVYRAVIDGDADVVIPSHYPNVIFSLANNRTSVNLFY
jgi:hypothetical protein